MFIYPNSSCLVGCDSPLVINDLGNGEAECQNPCSGYISLGDGTCEDTCSLSYYEEDLSWDGFKFCSYICEEGEYVSPDLECMSSCTSPLVIENEVECNSPCVNKNDFYVESTSECISSCDAPNSESTHEFIKLC